MDSARRRLFALREETPPRIAKFGDVREFPRNDFRAIVRPCHGRHTRTRCCPPERHQLRGTSSRPSHKPPSQTRKTSEPCPCTLRIRPPVWGSDARSHRFLSTTAARTRSPPFARYYAYIWLTVLSTTEPTRRRTHNRRQRAHQLVYPAQIPLPKHFHGKVPCVYVPRSTEPSRSQLRRLPQLTCSNRKASRVTACHNTTRTLPILSLSRLFFHTFCFQFTVSPSRISPTIGICICPPPAPAITRARTLAPVAPFPFPTPHDAQHIFSFYTHPARCNNATPKRRYSLRRFLNTKSWRH